MSDMEVPADGNVGELTAIKSLPKELAGRDELQKKFRQFETNRRLRREMRGLIPRLHEQQIAKLGKMSEKKRWELFLETETMKKMTGTSCIEQIQRLREQAERYGVILRQETIHVSELDKGIKDMENQLIVCRLSTGGQDSELKRSRMLERKTENHENLLDKALVKFNEASNSTKQLKEMIDFLRRERQVFDSVQDKMLREIREKSNATSAMLSKSDNCGHEADGFQEQMRSMKDVVDQEFKSLERAWHEIAAMMSDHSEGLEDLDEKHQNDLQHGTKLKASQNDKEAELMQRLMKVEGQTNAQREAIRQAKSKIEQQERLSAQIKQATSIDNVDALVDSFLKAEEDNFHLYKAVGGLQESIENVEEEISDLDKELSSFEAKESGDPNESESIRLRRDLSKKINEREQEANEYQGTTSRATSILTSMCSRVESIISKGDIRHPSGSNMLELTELTDLTITSFLGVIEANVVQLLDRYVTQIDKGNAGSLIREISHPDVVITPPVLEADSDDDDVLYDIDPNHVSEPIKHVSEPIKR